MLGPVRPGSVMITVAGPFHLIFGPAPPGVGVLDGVVLPKECSPESGVVVGLDYCYGCLLLQVKLLLHSFTGCELCCGEVVVHEDAGHAGLNSHCPLGSTVALDVGAVVDLRDHIADCSGQLFGHWFVWLRPLC